MGIENRLIAFIQQNFDVDDIWPDLHEDCLTSTREVASWATDEGWVDPADPRTYDADCVIEMAGHKGLTLGPDRATLGAYHDDNRHPGPIRWCTDPICKGD